MLYRMRFIELGGHTHVRVFAGVSVGALGKCGDLVFRNEEWADFRSKLGADVEVLPEDFEAVNVRAFLGEPNGWPQDYLGDAVYASFDGYHIWLKTGDGNNQQIGMEQSVYCALRHYAKKIWGENA